MDGLSALSVAASVAQFIELRYNIVSQSKEIYNSGHGALTQNSESSAATKRVHQLCEGNKLSLQLESSAGPASLQ
jgi:hypothetical protein